MFPRSNTDVHTVASLLKLYLRELPEPVIPFHKYDEFLNCAKLLGKDDEMVGKTNSKLLFVHFYSYFSRVLCSWSLFIRSFQLHSFEHCLLPSHSFARYMSQHRASCVFQGFELQKKKQKSPKVLCSFQFGDLWHVSAGHQGAEETGGIFTTSKLQPPQVHLQVKHLLQLQLSINKTASANNVTFSSFAFFPVWQVPWWSPVLFRSEQNECPKLGHSLWA